MTIWHVKYVAAAIVFLAILIGVGAGFGYLLSKAPL